MERPFDDLHAGIESQMLDLPAGIPDSEAVRKARAMQPSAEAYSALGKALSRQLRYREAIRAYTEALRYAPNDPALLRLRAGRYLTTLQSGPAIADLEKCLSLGAERLDCLYRIGLAHYYAGQYAGAAETFTDCLPLCGDEMGVAVIYWHTLSRVRMEREPELLRRYHTGMSVGHHTAYEKALRVWAGAEPVDGMLAALEREEDDLEYGIALYGLLFHPDCAEKEERRAALLRRDGFWPSFAYLAAWQDMNQ